jgi:hypothetical protein
MSFNLDFFSGISVAFSGKEFSFCGMAVGMFLVDFSFDFNKEGF